MNIDEHILGGLNEAQKLAVTNVTGPLLIIAGAGSGKTKALTQRIVYQIFVKGISPWNILGVTFTNKAAKEMKKRIIKLLYPDADLENDNLDDYDIPLIGTFHSTCVKILRRDIHNIGLENSFTIYDTYDQQILMKNLIKDHGMSDELNYKAVLHAISNCKNELIHPDVYMARTYNFFTEQVAKFYQMYEQKLKENKALDFDDLIMKTVELFEKVPEILDKYQEKFKYISVDEYQDTNHAQYKLMKMLAEKYRNICVVGDDWQSIYSWRGANMQNILDFNKDYPEAEVVKLEQNYRSTSIILDAADSVMKKNKKRTDKKLWTDREEGEKIQIVRAANEKLEAEYIILRLKDKLEKYEFKDYSAFSVLYRTNAQSRTLEEMLIRYGIPYRIVGGVRFYERKEIKDMVAYLRLIQNPSDSVSLMRIINVPTRKIGLKTIETIQEFANQKDITMWGVIREIENYSEMMSESKIKALAKFRDMIYDFQNMNRTYKASGMVKYIIENSGYRKFLLEDKTVEGEARFENVQELASVANKYEMLEPGISLATFLEEIALISDTDKLDEKDNSVTLMTVHSAKGLEFDHVFICGLEDGVFPHSRSMIDAQELEEERRLMYVALTRAKDTATLTFAEQRMLYGDVKSNAMSQFIEDIPEELRQNNFEHKAKVTPIFDMNGNMPHRPIPVEGENEEINYDDIVVELFVGDRVRHGSFGVGTVTKLTGGIVEVVFDEVGKKKLALSVAPLEKID